MALAFAEAPQVLIRRPELRKPKGIFPADATTMLLDPEQYGDHSAYYNYLKSQRPGFLLGAYPNIYRNGEYVYLEDRTDRLGATTYQTRGGKGTSFVIPNAFEYFHSLFVNDPKAEIMYYTAWWRRYMLGQRIFVVNPYDTSGLCARINLLDEVRERTLWEIQDAYNFATAVVDPDGKGMNDGKEAVWKKRARDLLAGIILHIKWAKEFEGNRSLTTCIDYATDPSSPFEEKLRRLVRYPHDPDYRYGWRTVNGELTVTHPFIAAKVQQQLDRPEAEAGSVKSEYESYLSLYQENLARINTTTSDFSVTDVMDGPIPATVYLWINPQNAQTAMPFIRLFFNLLINRNLVAIRPDPVTGRPIVNHDWNCGMILDEFTSVFGKLDIFAQQLAYVAGYGFKPWVILQDLMQLDEQYGEKNNIVSNLNTLLFGSMRNPHTAETFSKWLGKETVWLNQKSMNNQGGQWTQGYSETHMARDLMDPSQISRIPNEEAIALVSEQFPLPFKKIKFFKDDSSFAHKVVPFLGERSDRIPFQMQRTQINRREEEREYLAFCHRKGEEGTLRETFLDMGDKTAQYLDQLKEMREKVVKGAIGRMEGA
jgi:type IV secretion system protein VirD4